MVGSSSTDSTHSGNSQIPSFFSSSANYEHSQPLPSTEFPQFPDLDHQGSLRLTNWWYLPRLLKSYQNLTTELGLFMFHLFASGQFQAQVMGEAKKRGKLKYLEGKSHLFDKLRTACRAGLIY